MRQTSFSFIQDYKKQFGGSLLLGKRKSKRPLSVKKPIHLILKSEGQRFFNPANRSLRRLIQFQAKKFNIKLYDFAQNWTHIHLLIKLKDREDYIKFIRALTSILALKIRARNPDVKVIFTLRPFSRIVSWGRDFQNTLKYQIINIMEAFGEIKREKKKSKGLKRKKSLKT